jgi:hypothetical protein
VVGKDGKWDALDQLDDTPAEDETIYVYRNTVDHGTVHYSCRDKNGRRFCRWEQVAYYRLHESQPDDATARDNSRWAEWAKAEYERMKEA